MATKQDTLGPVSIRELTAKPPKALRREKRRLTKARERQQYVETDRKRIKEDPYAEPIIKRPIHAERARINAELSKTIDAKRRRRKREGDYIIEVKLRRQATLPVQKD